MKRLVLLGDSLGMPRAEVSYNESYPQLLRKRIINMEVISRHSRRNDTSEQVFKLNDDLLYIKPEIVCIHLGIVDCAPRLFDRKDNNLLYCIEFFKKVSIYIKSKYRFFFTKMFPKVYVPIDKYRKNMEFIIKKSIENNTKVVLINIAKTSKENELKSFSFDHNIKEYNSILFDLSQKYDLPLIDLYSEKNILLDDGIHLNLNGINIVVNKIIEVVDEL